MPLTPRPHLKTAVLKPEGFIYIDDGLISLRVESVGTDYVDCEIMNSELYCGN